MTVHVIAPKGRSEGALKEAQDRMRHDLGIEHSTIQVNSSPGDGCPLEI